MARTLDDWQAWLALLVDKKSTVRIEAAVHDHLPGSWRHDGLKIDAHINWFMLQGAVVGMVNGEKVQVPSGGSLCLAPDTPIHFQTQNPARPIHMLRFRLRLERNNKPCVVPGGGFVIQDARVMHNYAQQLLSLADADDPLSEQQQRGLLVALYAESAKNLTRKNSAVRGLSEEQLQSIDQLIAHHLPYAVAPAELAKALHMKPDTFARAFKRSREQSPRAWIAARRIRHAAELLLIPDASITEIADDCGYADVFHFSKQFKNIMGSSPRSWQQRHLG